MKFLVATVLVCAGILSHTSGMPYLPTLGLMVVGGGLGGIVGLFGFTFVSRAFTKTVRRGFRSPSGWVDKVSTNAPQGAFTPETRREP